MCHFKISGTHWVWEIVNMLLCQKATRISSMKESAMLEGSSGINMQNMSSPRVLNTHLLFSDLPTDFIVKKCKIVYVLRNIKDVAVSFYNHHVRLLDYEYSGTWRSYLSRFLHGKGVLFTAFARSIVVKYLVSLFLLHRNCKNYWLTVL